MNQKFVVGLAAAAMLGLAGCSGGTSDVVAAPVTTSTTAAPAPVDHAAATKKSCAAAEPALTAFGNTNIEQVAPADLAAWKALYQPMATGLTEAAALATDPKLKSGMSTLASAAGAVTSSSTLDEAKAAMDMFVASLDTGESKNVEALCGF
ncbi:hypothetical protein [Nocardia sp. XZ_19_385]|uniref:hypothetical protein n=1 Tax=Nocardia sp. XZ_19_385 TaxID=2769488 RepID=UPI00188F23E9|nr:hypothetical protein [Nocardia sp. XZ_19_385]